MSTATMTLLDGVMSMQPHDARSIGTEVGNHSVPVSPAQIGIVNGTSCKASSLSSREETTVEANAAEKCLRPGGILLVEDDRVLRKVLGQGLRNRGFDLWSAENGAEGIKLYQQFWPLIDIVLSDVQMPVMDGLEMFGALRMINPSVRFCFMTGDTQASACSSLLKGGALRIFEKPFPSITSIAEELWELALCPNHTIRIADNEPFQTVHLSRDGRTPGTPNTYWSLAAIWVLSPDSISRISSMLGFRDF